MDEIINATAATEDTTPQAETAEGAAPEADPTPAENTNTEQPEGTTPEAEGGTEDPQTPVTPFVTVKYNHETRDLTREQAIAYAQKGILYDEGPLMQKLALMAAAQGMSPDEYVTALAKADEEGLLEDKLRVTGGDREAAEILVKAEMDKRRNALGIRAKEEAEAEQKAEQATLDRLAGELVELQQIVPELADWDAIPQAVKEDAIKNNRNLTDAYLRYMHREGKNIKQNRAAQAAAAAASTGSQADHPPAGENPDIAAIDAGIRAVFG